MKPPSPNRDRMPSKWRAEQRRQAEEALVDLELELTRKEVVDSEEFQRRHRLIESQRNSVKISAVHIVALATVLGLAALAVSEEARAAILEVLVKLGD